MREGLDRGADHTRDKHLCLSAGFANRKGKSLETELGNELRTRDMGKLTTRGCAKRMIAEVDKSAFMLLLHFLKSRSRSLEPSNAGRFLCPMFFPVVKSAPFSARRQLFGQSGAGIRLVGARAP